MRIAWFTPFSIKSAIGKYSKSATDELVKYCEVDLWLSESSNLLESGLKKIYYSSKDDLSQQLSVYDFIIYNLGDNLASHREIYNVSRKFKGIVILHDYVMQSFFASYYLELDKNMREYEKWMGMFYGEEGRKIAKESIFGKRTPVWETPDEMMEYPLFEKAIHGAMGVVVHSKIHAKKVNEKYFGPVRQIYHPFFSKEEPTVKKHLKKEKLDVTGDTLLIVSVGVVNRNKRTDKIIEVLGEEGELAENIVFFIIGHYDKQTKFFSHLESLVDKYGLQEVVKFLGYQQDDRLVEYMSRADIFINLRYPQMEGASWSLVEEMSFGKPVVVMDTGFYAEIPDDCVLKIRVDNEKKELARTLKKIVNDEKIRKRTGDRGKKFAVENFNTGNYCNNFLQFLDEVGDFKPILNLIDRVGVELDLMGVTQDMGVIDKIAKESYLIFR